MRRALVIAALLLALPATAQWVSGTSAWQRGGIASSGGGISTLNTLTGATQTFADVDDTNVTLAIGSAGTTHTFTIAWSGTLAATRGGNGTGTYTLGDILYSDAANSLAKLAGNTTATKKFLRQTGNGTISAAPAWDTIVAGDLPGGVVSGLTTNRVPYASSATALADSPIYRASADITQLSRTTNPQLLYIYNTTSSDSTPASYERLEIGPVSNTFKIVTGINGGSSRALDIGTTGNSGFTFRTNDAIRFTIQSTGHTQSGNGGNTYDWGIAGGEWRSVYLKTSIQGGNVKTLTESSNTNFGTVSVANVGTCDGEVYYTIFAADATNAQSISGILHFAAVANSSGTVTSTSAELNALNPVSTGTLTNTFTLTNGANLLTIGANAASSLTQTTLNITYRIHVSSGTCTVTAL